MKKEPVKVLQIIRHMNVGGAETFIMNLYRNIDREKVQFDFLVYGKGFFDEEIRNLGGKIFYMDYITKIGQLKYKKQLSNFFKEHPEYQIVHSHIDQVTGIILETANECGIKIRIAHSHNTSNANNLLARLYKKYLQSKINKNATQYFACGEDAAKWLFKEKSSQATIIPNGIDLERFKYNEETRNKIRKELNIKKDTFVCGHIGRFSKQKNHEFLIKLYKEYQKINTNSKLILVGDGKLRKKIEEEVKKEKLEKNVMFLGNRKDSENLYQAFDLLLFPSLFEGMSLVTLEAQAEGLPMLCSDTIDKNTNITNTIEFMSLQEDASSWAKKIQEVPKTRNLQNNKILEKTDYNIKNLAKKMEEKYIDLYKRG